MSALSKAVRAVAEAYVRQRFTQEERKRVVARAQRKARQTYRMSAAQAAVFRRIKIRGYITKMEYLAEDWRVTNAMFSRGWLKWSSFKAEARVTVGDKAPALEVRP